ncbi:MAG: hypothetical protein ACI9MR_005235, partial [Myxococcota bacterium]
MGEWRLQYLLKRLSPQASGFLAGRGKRTRKERVAASGVLQSRGRLVGRSGSGDDSAAYAALSSSRLLFEDADRIGVAGLWCP